MRNIAQYPITSDEVIEAADQAFEGMSERLQDSIGTPVPYSLHLLCEFIREEEVALVAFLERKAKELKDGKP